MVSVVTLQNDVTFASIKDKFYASFIIYTGEKVIVCSMYFYVQMTF